MTQEWLMGLPENLQAGQVYQVLGVKKAGLRVLRELHPELVVRKMGKGKSAKCVYSRAVVFELAKVNIEHPTSNFQLSTQRAQR